VKCGVGDHVGADTDRAIDQLTEKAVDFSEGSVGVRFSIIAVFPEAVGVDLEPIS
jgi:hypothetical protein